MKKTAVLACSWMAALLLLCSGCSQSQTHLPLSQEERGSALSVSSDAYIQQAPGPELLGFTVSYGPAGWEGESLFAWCNRVMDEPRWSVFAAGPQGRVEVVGNTLLEGWPCRLHLVFSADRQTGEASLSQVLRDGEPAEYTLEQLRELCRLPEA